MDKTYNPKNKEDKIYKMWEKKGYFTAKPSSKKKPFCIIMPPPNANGVLHIGHALFVTLQDIMIRYHRMKVDAALWLPGADHAGFETQVVFDKKLAKEKRKKSEIPKKQLIKEMMDFTKQNKKIMESQLRKLGASCDWTRNKFTLEPDIIKTVYNTFEKLKKDNLVYKGARLVNWCTKHQTSLSELEVKHKERSDPLYYIKYGPFKLATVRPETKFGDTAIAVHPDDKRYQKYIGKEIDIETILGKATIKVVADKFVDMEFGTGAVKVTPAHDFNDYEIWQRHKNEIPGPKVVIDKYGKMNEKAGPYKGMKPQEAREKVVKDMIKKGLLNEKDTDYNYKHSVAVCYKCGTIIEPFLLDNQWFVKMAPLRDLAVTAVRKGEIKFIPSRFEKIFLHWMKDLHDWNISRQIPWGIEIPEKGDAQVFDTWFSSGQWPFAALQNTKKGDFKYFYPTSVMETGSDILFFWVSRMIMLGIYVTGKVPFRYVYLHGMVRDKDRQKMSKSKGNVIDPLGVVDLYGADALRMALVFANSPGQDISFSEEKIIAQRRFANKIWNAARFVITQTENFQFSSTNFQSIFNEKATQIDKNILNALNKTTKAVTKDIENFNFHTAAEKLYHFFWHTFCDKYIEQSKKQAGDKSVLLYVLTESLKLLHPFMPFITEQIYQLLPQHKKDAIIIEQWPI